MRDQAAPTEPAPILIDGRWRPAANPSGQFQAHNPATGALLPGAYPVSRWADIEAALEAATRAVAELRSTPPAALADFLERYAAGMEARGEEIAQAAHEETALPLEARLRNNELPRTIRQLRLAAAAARDGSWRQPTIDTAGGLRSQYAALGGAVVVIGPNNFPLAFASVSGGDLAAAVAAGNPVIAKAHPLHPHTTRLAAEAAAEAIAASGVPSGLVQLLYHFSPEDGIRLVQHPAVAATAFTGSRRTGLALKAAAEQAGKLIYLEMSSVNPVFVLPGALDERLPAVAQEFFSSCTLGSGQFCTNPGLVVVLDNAQGQSFVNAAASLFQGAAPTPLLAESVETELEAGLETLKQNGAEVVVGGHAAQGAGWRFDNTLLRVSGNDFLKRPAALQTEAFGPLSLVVLARDEDQLLKIAGSLEGNLTGGIYSASGGADEPLYHRLEPVLRPKVGRLLNDKMPTGVAVSPAMNHGGPYPSTGHPGFTAVGLPASMLRFAALQSYDNVREHRLPPELRDKNLGGIWRRIDGQWTQADVPISN
jgi:alpha-ketoglutaric semialdehyde dehydrogenase